MTRAALADKARTLLHRCHDRGHICHRQSQARCPLRTQAHCPYRRRNQHRQQLGRKRLRSWRHSLGLTENVPEKERRQDQMQTRKTTAVGWTSLVPPYTDKRIADGFFMAHQSTHGSNTLSGATYGSAPLPRTRYGSCPIQPWATMGVKRSDHRLVRKNRFEIIKENGGWYRDRTCDPYHVKVVLYR